MIKIYVDLDALFDTRYTVIKRVYDIDIGTYLSRKSDNFKYIGSKQFKELYKHRNRNTLLKSKETNIMGGIINSIARNNMYIIERGDTGNVSLELNMYPYKLNDDDIDAFRGYIKSKLSNVDIKLIYKKPGTWLLNGYCDIFSYDGMYILNMLLRDGRIDMNPISDLSITLPSIVDDEFDVKDYDKIFLGLMDLYRPFIDLQFIDVSHFCNEKIIKDFNSD